MKLFRNKKTEYSSGDVKVTEIVLDEEPKTVSEPAEEPSPAPVSDKPQEQDIPAAAFDEPPAAEPLNEEPQTDAESDLSETEEELPHGEQTAESAEIMPEKTEIEETAEESVQAQAEIEEAAEESVQAQAEIEEAAKESAQAQAEAEAFAGPAEEEEKPEEPQKSEEIGEEPISEEQAFVERIKAERVTDNERAAHVYAETAERVEEVGKARYAGSSEEKKAARVIRDLFEDELGGFARMEPFDVRPFATVQGLPVFAAISVVAFILSCIWSPLGVLLFPTVAAMIFVQVIKNKDDFSKLFPKRTSYNVVSVIENGEKRIGKTVVLGCHYDTDYGRMELPKWIAKQNSASLHTFMTWYAFAANLLLAALSVACIFLKSGPKAIVMFVGFVALAVSVVYMATYVTYFKLGARMNKNALSGLGLTLAVAQHLKLNSEEIPSDVRVVVAAFGSSYAGAKGSEAFLEEHYGKDNLLINPVFLDVSALRKNEANVVVADKNLKLNYGGRLAETAFETLKESGLTVDKVVEQGRFADATSFQTKDIPSVFLDGGIQKESLFGETESDVETRYNAVLNLVRRIMKE
ncbi:MAG: hypothetical protein SPH86_05680 [Eubacteriales bacterium]|nr:hypothetical protein [Eubacteriales bacterium]